MSLALDILLEHCFLVTISSGYSLLACVLYSNTLDSEPHPLWLKIAFPAFSVCLIASVVLSFVLRAST